MSYEQETASNWCYDAAVTTENAPPPPNPQAHAHQSWPHLFAAVLDILRPFPDAHAAVRQLTRHVLAHLPAPT